MLAQLGGTRGSGEEAQIAARFVWDLISQMGFAPELGRCINCKSMLSGGTFSCEGGGMLCALCAGCDVFADAVDESMLAELAGREEALGARSQAIIKRFWNHVFEYPIASWDFFHLVAA